MIDSSQKRVYLTCVVFVADNDNTMASRSRSVLVVNMGEQQCLQSNETRWSAWRETQGTRDVMADGQLSRLLNDGLPSESRRKRDPIANRYP
jgi:hypothetical protein